MAKKLNLNAEWIDKKTGRITWNDPVLAEFSVWKTVLWSLGIASISIFAFVMFVIKFSLGWLVASLSLPIVGLLLFRRNKMVENGIEFGVEQTTHKGKNFPTAEITRFDYGLRSQLTGQAPQVDGHGKPMRDPMLVRLWLNDTAPYEVSMNNWDMTVNHEIRDALAKALDAVRNIEKQGEKEAEFGETGDFGMPDY